MLLRFYRPFVERVAMALIFLRDSGFSFKQSLDHAARGRADVSSNLNYVLRKAATHQTPEPELKEMIEEIERQMEQREVGDGEMIDLIVNTLQLPFARNTLSGVAIEHLRQAILLPQELAGLRHRLQTQETACGRCGRELGNGEIGVLLREGGGRNVIRCVRCLDGLLISVACPKCEGGTTISPKLLKALRGVACRKCDGKNTPVLEPPQAVVDLPDLTAATPWETVGEAIRRNPLTVDPPRTATPRPQPPPRRPDEVPAHQWIAWQDDPQVRTAAQTRPTTETLDQTVRRIGDRLRDAQQIGRMNEDRGVGTGETGQGAGPRPGGVRGEPGGGGG